MSSIKPIFLPFPVNTWPKQIFLYSSWYSSANFVMKTKTVVQANYWVSLLICWAQAHRRKIADIKYI